MKVFLDTNVFINGLKYPESNSRKILELAKSGAIRAVTSELALKETSIVLRRLSGSKAAYLGTKYVQSLCEIIPRRKIRAYMKQLKGLIKEKDLENIASVKSMKIQFIVSHDRDYKNFSEHRTPKKFMQELGLQAWRTEY